MLHICSCGKTERWKQKWSEDIKRGLWLKKLGKWFKILDDFLSFSFQFFLVYIFKPNHIIPILMYSFIPFSHFLLCEFHIYVSFCIKKEDPVHFHNHSFLVDQSIWYKWLVYTAEQDHFSRCDITNNDTNLHGLNKSYQ